MNRIVLYIILFLILPVFQPILYSQHQGYRVGYKIEGRDTVFQINLDAVYHFAWDKNRMKGREWREFYRLVYNFRKTYPYALMAKNKIQEADSVLNSKRFSAKEREKYIKNFESKLFTEFEKPLRKMTISQGKLLLKLIDREVGQTSYSLIKGYKSNAAAGFWQGIARLFGSDLKKPYDRFGDDKLTEELVQMYQRGSFDYLYYSLF
jgi:hypothetical protein